jgi:hypothetical protein
MFAESQLSFFKLLFLTTQKFGTSLYHWNDKEGILQIQKSPSIHTLHRYLYRGNIVYGILITLNTYRLLSTPNSDGTSSDATSTLLNLLSVFGVIAAIIFALSNFKNSSHLAQLLKEIFQHERRNHQSNKNNYH